MDGDAVKDEPSDKPKYTSLAEMFTDVCPFYMSLGMTYDQFWHCNTRVHKAYREAYKIKQRNDEFDRWRRGIYFYTAIRCAPLIVGFDKDAKPEPYPDRPLPLTQKEAEEQEQQREIENYYERLKKRKEESTRNLEKMAKAKMQEVSEDG